MKTGSQHQPDQDALKFRRLAYLHGFLGDSTDADRWDESLRDVTVRGPHLGLAASWSAEIDRLAGKLADCDAVMGYSMGARLALAVAIERPDTVPALVLISGSPGLFSETDRVARRRDDDEWRRRLLEEPIDRFLHDWYRQPVFAGDPLDCLAQLREERRNICPTQQAHLLRTLSVAEQPDYRPRIHELEIPVLFLAGSRDTKYVELAHQMSQRARHGVLHVVEGGGHVIHRSHLAVCVELITSFLKTTSARADDSAGRGRSTAPLVAKARNHQPSVGRPDTNRHAGVTNRNIIPGKKPIGVKCMSSLDWKSIKEYQDIRYEQWESIAKITIDRPEVRNAFRPLTVNEMREALQLARHDASIGVVILTGAGDKAFCSGGDQKIRGDAGYRGEDGGEYLNVLDFQREIRTCPKPVIAMVAGYAIGGGHVLHMMCDLTIAADNAIFGQTGPKVGSFDGGYGASYMARIVGQKKAREIWFLCRQYNAQQALDMGLVNHVVPYEQLEAETIQWCREILEKSPIAIRCLKAALNADCDGQAGLQELAGNATMLFYMTEEGQEGRNAFVQKRPPDFTKFPRRG